MPNRVAERAQLVFVQLLLLVGDVLALAGFAQAVALDRARQDDRRLPLVLHGGLVGRVDLHRVVAAQRAASAVPRRSGADQRLQARVAAEQVLADVGARLRRSTSGTRRRRPRPGARASSPSVSLSNSGSQSLPQMHLMTFQPAPRKTASSSWMIWPLPRTGPSSRCRLQLMTKMRLSSFSRLASVMAPSVSGSSVSPSPRNAQTLRSPSGRQAAIVEVAHEPRLVDRHDRARGPSTPSGTPRSPASARDAGTTTGRRPACSLAAEVLELLDRQPPFEKRPGVDAGRGVALEEDDVAVVAVRPCP